MLDYLCASTIVAMPIAQVRRESTLIATRSPIYRQSNNVLPIDHVCVMAHSFSSFPFLRRIFFIFDEQRNR